ncbi:MAG: hypothetical protein Q4A74_06930, partial [Cardiobacteriaceae bacterium]|nr:hypothetical protein [Cardiobacteriaceae bacterium]
CGCRGNVKQFGDLLQRSHTFSDNRIESLANADNSNAAARLLYTGSNEGGNVFTGNIVSGRTAAGAFGAEAVWDKTSSGDIIASYAHNMQDAAIYRGEITHGGGFGNMDGVVFNNNILAPEITQRPLTPVIYLGADSSHGQDGTKNIEGNITDLSMNGNILLSNKNIGEIIHTHENGAQVHWHGDGVHQESDGTYTNGAHTVYSNTDYTLETGETTLYLVGISPTNGHGNHDNNSMIGNGCANILNGDAGNDILDGGYGADTLIGGTGADTFVFKSKIDGNNLDTIQDFNRAEGDKIALNKSVFGELQGKWFVHQGEQITLETRVIQQGDTLLYDADGSGNAYHATAFAKLQSEISLNNNDFIL